jgi:hypothetical protein
MGGAGERTGNGMGMGMGMGMGSDICDTLEFYSDNLFCDD